MNLILGIVVVFGCVLGGFAVHGGQLAALWQPSELLIIGGAAIGALIIAKIQFQASPKRVAAGIGGLNDERRAIQEGSLPRAVLGDV
ncbi:motility-associated protein [Steroidobacter cummioxidans]|uniref:motility-associated protein n=1 Tax=Steroidobacter cummioxidans TaxID=1803913 RepID=UPI0019D4730E|nr:motility-associated protein [Steroidobacter cummioxidans]